MAILSFKKLINAKPQAHFLIIILFYFFVSIIFNAFNFNAELKWICIFSLLLFYCWINPMVGAFTKKWSTFTLQSTLYILLFSVIFIVFEFFFGNDYILDSFENTMLLLATYIFYLVAIGICGIFRLLAKVLEQSPM